MILALNKNHPLYTSWIESEDFGEEIDSLPDGYTFSIPQSQLTGFNPTLRMKLFSTREYIPPIPNFGLARANYAGRKICDIEVPSIFFIDWTEKAREAFYTAIGDDNKDVWNLTLEFLIEPLWMPAGLRYFYDQLPPEYKEDHCPEQFNETDKWEHKEEMDVDEERYEISEDSVDGNFRRDFSNPKYYESDDGFDVDMEIEIQLLQCTKDKDAKLEVPKDYWNHLFN